MSAPLLIVNADDFGRSQGVNDGVACAFEEGILTSASLMVRWPAAVEAAAYARARPELGVGLHIDLGEWEHRSGAWIPVYEVGGWGRVDEEVRSQLERFRELVGADPTHLDSHQHIHRAGPAREAVRQLGAELDVPVRGESPVRYCGSFYGATAEGEPLPEAVTEVALAELVRSVTGDVELGCHPAARVDFPTSYAAQRTAELRALCSPAVSAAVADAGVRLGSFRSLAPTAAPDRSSTVA